MFHIPTDRAVLAYAAGVFDGEGSASITKASNRYHTVRVDIVNTSATLMTWLVENFGWKVTLLKPNKGSLGRRPMYAWILRNDAVEQFLTAILPFLVIKKAQAEVAIAFRQIQTGKVRNGRWPTVTAEVVAQREEARLKMRVLNGRG